MKQFLRVWGGHILAVITLGLFTTTAYYGWIAADAADPDDGFMLFLITTGLFILTLVVGGAATFFWNTHAQRTYVRHLYKPLGEPDARFGDADPWPYRSPAGEAHSDDEKGI